MWRPSRRSGSYSPLELGLAAPAVLLAGASVLIPLVWATILTVEPSKWESRAGWAAAERLFRDSRTLDTMARSLGLALVTAVTGALVGLLIAMALEYKVPGWKYLRLGLFVPYLLPTASIAAAWRLALDPYFGWGNALLGFVNPSLIHAWLGDPTTGLATVAFTTVLQATGFTAVMLQLAISRVPSSLHEVAMIDGAGGLRRFWVVIIPKVRLVIVSLFALQFTWGFLVFDQVRVMTNGGTGTSSEVVSTFAYHAAFEEHDLGIAAAASLLAALALLPAVYWYSHQSRLTFEPDGSANRRGSPPLPSSRLQNGVVRLLGPA